MDPPRITIITPSFGQASFLEETLRSVIDQGYPELEYLVVDGGSTDGSVEIIQRHAAQLAWWVSEPDRGQSHAINKALARATGDIIGWINSDDLLLPGALHHVAERFTSTGALCLCGPIHMFQGDREWTYPAAYAQRESLHAVLGRDDFNQPGTFFHRDALARMGPLDERLHFAMDKEWFIRFLLLHGTRRIAVTGQPLARYRHHADTKTSAQAHACLTDYAAILYRMAERGGATELMDLLRAKFPVEGHPYRFSEALPVPERRQLHQQVAMFLLRHFHDVWQEADFLFARRMVQAIHWNEVELRPHWAMALRRMQHEARWGNWQVYRAARKLGLAGRGR